MLTFYSRINFGQEIMGAPVSSNNVDQSVRHTHAECANVKREIGNRATEEIPIEVFNGPKKWFITTNGANEIDFGRPSRMPFDKNVHPGLYKFLETVSSNTDWYPQRQLTDRRPLRRVEITGDNDGIRQPLQNMPVAVFDNNSGNMASNQFHDNEMENPQMQPSPPPPPILPSLPSAMLGFGLQPSFAAKFQPNVFSECPDCMFNDEIRSRPPFPIYNYNFGRMNGMMARETLQLNDRTGIEGAYIMNSPAIWK